MATLLKSPKDVVRAIPESAHVVLLGECTHGTQEFYTYRAEVTKQLIEQRGFQLVCVEADWPYMWHINEYIHRRRRQMFPFGVKFPEWMWQNKPFVELIKYLRASEGEDNLNVFGLDCYSRDQSQVELQRFLDAHYPDLATRLRFACPEEWPKLLSRLQWHGGHPDEVEGSAKDAQETEPTKFEHNEPTKFEQFSAEQNLECMIAAEEYYAKQRLEPSGSQASWNARDQHMVTTLLRVKNLLGNPKVVVWAHNSHVGDSTATPKGGEDFKRNETWNLGQMCRSVLDDVHIVGFYSHQGTVYAAQRWGGNGQCMNLLPSIPYSFENIMHNIVANMHNAANGNGNGGNSGAGGGGAAGAGAILQADVSATKQGPPSFQFVEHPVNQEYRILHQHVVCASSLPSTRDDVTKREAMTQYPRGTFVPVQRKQTKDGVVCLQTDTGDWVYEYTPDRGVTTHCLPSSHPHFGAASLNIEQARAHLLEFPMLQRWVGVQYHPETEFQSHYGEVVMGRCYDTVVFIDTTQALNTNIEEEADSAASAKEQPSALAIKRLMREYRVLIKDPPPNVQAHLLDENILEWHFVITGTQEPYKGGRYHGVLEFPPSFPMSPPAIRMLTPSGRFDVNKRICFSMSDYHKELWNPAWTVQTILVGIQSFFYEESDQVGGMRRSAAERRKLAAQSVAFNMRNGIYVELFCGEQGARPSKKKKKKSTRKQRRRKRTVALIRT